MARGPSLNENSVDLNENSVTKCNGRSVKMIHFFSNISSVVHTYLALIAA